MNPNLLSIRNESLLQTWGDLVSVGTFPERRFVGDAPVEEEETETIGFRMDSE